MGGGAVTQWVFTTVFTVLALVHAVWLASDRGRWAATVGNALHLLMSVAMVAMVWTTPGPVLALAQIVAFGAATGWFTVLAGLRATGKVRLRTVGGHDTMHLVGHGVMAAAMVWMAAVMAVPGPGAAGHQHANAPVAAVLVGVTLTAALIATGVLLFVDLVDCVRIRGTWRRHTWDLTSGVAMSLAMAAMCWAMLG